MKRDPNAITYNGSTYAKGSRVSCHLGEAIIARLYEPTANEEAPRAMLDRGEAVSPAYARFPVVNLDKLELVEDGWEHVGDAASRVVNGLARKMKGAA